ncbi:SufE family protein [Alteromonas gilva]|uniref:SufE family protein n=1 Tax=Alteromonas gilva TaxID=2987522 RepID=A0ABT5L6D9_9ALTE|nr:SufE family protein [Alteromonas gilva]MDC8831323.1 SufE family protein [Alteromonas gilva]
MSELPPLAAKLAASKGWDNLVRQLMLAGRELNTLPPEQRTSETEVTGCQSRVWLHVIATTEASLVMQAWSDSKIIRGVLALIEERVRPMTPEQLSAFNFGEYFAQIQLDRYLSQSRANGINEVIKRLQR